jgi:hypothetical protein
MLMSMIDSENWDLPQDQELVSELEPPKLGRNVAHAADEYTRSKIIRKIASDIVYLSDKAGHSLEQIRSTLKSLSPPFSEKDLIAARAEIARRHQDRIEEREYRESQERAAQLEYERAQRSLRA